MHLRSPITVGVGLISGENNCYICLSLLCKNIFVLHPKTNLELLKSPYISIIIGDWSLQRSLPTATDSTANLRAGFASSFINKAC